MIRCKEDLLKALKICQSDSCDCCPYEDIGCSPSLAYDAEELIKQQEIMISDLKRSCQTSWERINRLRDNLLAVLEERNIIDSVPRNGDEINSASAASQRRKEQHGNPEQE